jgi:hypothetical protein
MLDTPQGYPRAGSQSFPTPAVESRTFALSIREDVENWREAAIRSAQDMGRLRPS